MGHRGNWTQKIGVKGVHADHNATGSAHLVPIGGGAT